jgi:hypothetical protein
MNRYICQIDGHNKTALEAIDAFCKEMFEEHREVELNSLAGNAFGGYGLSFALRGGENNYKVVFRSGMKVFEFFRESEI